MNIIIDTGNTLTKVAFFTSGRMENFSTVTTEEEIYALVQQYKPEYGIVCSVSRDVSALQRQLGTFLSSVYVLDYRLPVPLSVHYETPQTLGMDRLAAVTGARTLYPKSASLVVDLGTCITYDFVTAANQYLGGSISPGLRMRFRSLHTFTSRLPLLEPPGEEIPLVGSNTQQAIYSGVVNGTATEIHGIIKEYRKKFGKFHVIFCGGDAKFFESKIKETIFVIPELVLVGLNRILEHNVLEI